MLKLILATALSLSAFSTSAQDAAGDLAKANFCKARTQQGALQDIISKHDASLSFANQGGIFGGGVCWWHSRFTRNAAYLARFRPELPQPTEEEARVIIKAIRKGKSLIEIPGFRNLTEFSWRWDQLILRELEAWQRNDGIVRQQWIRGLSGSSNIKPEALQKRMEELYVRIQNGEVVYQKLQLPGIVAHAWLVVGMEPIANGYDLHVLDSNFFGVQTHRYYFGDTSLNYFGMGNFVPYTEMTKEERRMRRLVESECNLQSTTDDAEDDDSSDEEREQN